MLAFVDGVHFEIEISIFRVTNTNMPTIIGGLLLIMG